MMSTENMTPINSTTNNQQQAEPDMFDRFAAWAKPRLSRLIDRAIDNPTPYLDFIGAAMDNRRMHRNVRRVIERSQEIELQTANLHMRTGLPGGYPARVPQRLDQGAGYRQALPQGESEKRS